MLNDIEDELIIGMKEIAFALSNEMIENLNFPLFTHELLMYLQKNWNEIEALLVLQPDLRFMEKWKDVIKLHLNKHLLSSELHANYNLILESVSSAILSSYIYWIKNPDEFNEVELINFFQKIITSI